MQYLLRVSPDYLPPTHLAPLFRCLERIDRGEQVNVVCSTPPRGAKTESLLHALGWLLDDHPDWELGYCSYNATQARSKSLKGMQLAQRAGIPLIKTAITDWRTSEGGGVIAKGIGEGITGQGQDVTVVDDPVKDRAEAESEIKRKRALDWFNEALYTRGNPSTAKRKRPRSIIVNMARWHPDDLAGQLLAMKGENGEPLWEHINIPAIDEHGRSYWPEVWPIEKLEQIRRQIGEWSFASLLQCTPRPRGGAVFGDPWVWSPGALPVIHRAGLGLDLAFSAKTSADYSVIVVMLVSPEGYFYIVDCVRVQTRAPEFVETVKLYKARYPAARARWYASGTEIGIGDFIERPQNGMLGWLEVIQATSDKFIRAQPVAAAWNAHRVLVPEDSLAHPWVNDFLSEVVNFTGVKDVHDDQVDAMAAAYDLIALAMGYQSGTAGTRRM